MSAPESSAFPVFELAAGAEPIHLQAIQEECKTEGESLVSSWHKLEHFSLCQLPFVDTEILSSTVLLEDLDLIS